MSKETHTLCFDYSHNNKLVIESSSYNEFVNYLFASSFRIGQIKQGINVEKLKKYDMVIFGNPFNSLFDLEEIAAIEQYVREGGGIFLISDDGGDYENETNFNELTEKFGFTFNPDMLSDSMKYVKSQDKPIISKIEPHYVTKDVHSFVYASGCSISVDESIEADENISINILAKSGLNTFTNSYNGEQYEEIDAPHSPVLVTVNYHKGRVVAFGNVSIFSSLSSFYGYNALDNNILISNIINWLIKSDESNLDIKVISVPVNYTLALWMEKLVSDKEWDKVSDIINFSIKYLKDNYINVIDSAKERRKKLKEIREQREKDTTHKKEEEEQKRADLLGNLEDDILSLVKADDERGDKDAGTLDSILGDLAKFTEEED